MIYWAPFLHFYQPPTQFHAILQKVCKESYRPLLDIFQEYPKSKVTINMCGVLTEMLNNHAGRDIIDKIRALADGGTLEFVESGKYHPILPLIPEVETRRQIELNHKTNSYFFGESYNPQGFFSPEMCYSDGLAAILVSMGYKWLLIGGIACTEPWPLDVIYKTKFDKGELIILYRDDILSNKISFQGIDSRGFISQLKGLSSGKKNIYVITAMDAETFGHHIQHWERFFLGDLYETITEIEYPDLEKAPDLAKQHKKIFDSTEDTGKIEVVTISELLNIFTVKEGKKPLPSSWSTTKEDIHNKNYYPLWKNIHNPIHKLQWEHIDLCFELVYKAEECADSKESKHFVEISRSFLDGAIHSCQFWWANKGRMWDVNMVNKGLLLQEEVLLNAYRSISVSGCDVKCKENCYKDIVVARDIAGKIIDLVLEVYPVK